MIEARHHGAELTITQRVAMRPINRVQTTFVLIPIMPISLVKNYKKHFLLHTLFSKNSIFAYRTMFWWGNFFSATLHLEGIALDYYRNSITINLDRLLKKDVYIGVGDTPWQYHYEEDNYLLLNEAHRDFITNSKFLKLSKKIELKKWNDLLEFSTNFFELMLSVLKLRT